MKTYWAEDVQTGCWNWSSYTNKQGYGKIKLNGKYWRAHRLIYESQVGPIGESIVCHSCDNPSCVNPSHLFLGTHLDNAKDRDSKGRHVKVFMKGILHGRARLTEGDVVSIRRGKSLGHRNMDLAIKYGVARTTISEIVNHKTWTHI